MAKSVEGFAIIILLAAMESLKWQRTVIEKNAQLNVDELEKMQSMCAKVLTFTENLMKKYDFPKKNTNIKIKFNSLINKKQYE